jgi:hypothetical protein
LHEKKKKEQVIEKHKEERKIIFNSTM